jgi:hypothetical protein
MTKEQLSLTEIMEFKKTLKQLYPTAVKNISGKDVIYLQKYPGTDVAIYSDGTSVYSDSYTSTKPRLRRGKDISAAFYTAYDEGYRPIYDPQGTWISNRAATKKQEKQREMEMTSIFNPVKEIKRTPTPRREIPEPENFSQEITMPPQQQMRNMEPRYNLRQEQNEYDPNYFDKVLLGKIKKAQNRKPIENYWETPATATGMYSKDIKAAVGLENFIFKGENPKTAAQRINEIKKAEKLKKEQEKQMKKQLQLQGGQLI